MRIGRSVIERLRFGFICMSILTSFFFGPTSSVSAQVDAQATTRYVASSGVDSGNCSSSASPCLRIQYAVNQSVSGDRILVAQGTYTYRADINPCIAFLQTNGVVCVLDKVLTILGGYTTADWSTANPSVNLTVIDGEDTLRGVVVIGYQTTTTNLDMEGFTIQNGKAQGPLYAGVPGGRGGGMWVQNAATTLKDMVFKNNRSMGDAGTLAGAGGSAEGSGLAIDGSPAGTSSLLQRVTFDGNQSLAGAGTGRGGVAFGALFVYASVVTIEDSTFTNNRAQAGNSGGNGSYGGLSADALGGAIGLENSWAVINRIVATSNQVIGGNAVTSAGGAYGGAIYSEGGSYFSVTDSVISNNIAQAGNAATGGFGAGGGILAFNTPAIIDRVELINNSAIGGSTTGGGSAGPGGGGGLYLWRANAAVSANSSVTNSVITDNYVSIGSGTVPGGGGGGVQAQGVTATITHTTIARNRLGPSLISGQGLLVLSSPDVLASTVNLNYSIVSDHTVGGTNAAAILVQLSNTINFNRGLFAGNTRDKTIQGSETGQGTMASASSAGYISPGSPDYNYHLRSDSAARDQAVGSTTPIDLDAQSRPYNGVSDIGAYEFAPVTINRSVLRGNGSLQLNWALGGGLFTGSVSKYELVVTCAGGGNPPNEGACGAPINVGTVTTFTLTGLTNFQPYTMVINAYDSSLVLIATSTPITANPTDTLVTGRDTTGVFRPSNGLLYLKHANTSGFADVAINYGVPADYPVVGDWDGNGTASIGVYRNGQFLLRNSNTLGFADLVFAFGTPGDQPIAGDWDGDGTDTIGVFRPTTGQFLLRNSNSAGSPDISFYLGNTSDVGIAGDWNGDGVDTTGVFRPSNGVLFMKNANTSGFADIAINYGIPGDRPVTGDWDNDGIDTIGVYRNGQFMLRNSNTLGFADLVFALGIPGDMPIAGNWDGSNP